MSCLFTISVGYWQVSVKIGIETSATSKILGGERFLCMELVFFGKQRSFLNNRFLIIQVDHHFVSKVLQ